MSEIFDVNYILGHLLLREPLDYEQKSFYQFLVQASDDGLPPKISTTNVLVNVIDENDNAPIFTKNGDKITIFESSETSRIIYQVSATDFDSDKKDGNGAVGYRIVEGNKDNAFYVEYNTGAIVTFKPLDRESVNFYRLIIVATDGGTPPLTSEIPFTLDITVADTNDNKPIFDQEKYEVNVNEDTEVGESIKTLTVRDPDLGLNGQFNVSVKELTFQQFFRVQQQTDVLYDLKLLQPLNYELRRDYTFTVIAEDFGEPKLEKSVTIELKVLDVNDNKPKFQKSLYTKTMSDTTKANETVIQMVATDPDIGPGDRLSYEIVGGNTGNAFVIDQFTGIIQTADRSNLTFQPSYELQIVAKDSFEGSLRLTSNITTLYIRVTKTPNIELTDLQLGQNLITATIDLKDFAHLEDLTSYEVLVQIHEPFAKDFDMLSQTTPTTWYNVFSNLDDPSGSHLRPYTALKDDYPTNKKSISVVIGNNVTCTRKSLKTAEVCNGPLDAGKSYRLKVRVYENNNQVPISSHYSSLLTLAPISPDKATLMEATEGGMMALAAAFCIVFAAVVLTILAVTCWKMKHELIYVDHLRESRDQQIKIVEEEEKNNEHFPQYGKIGQFADFSRSGMWPELSMTEHNQMLHRSKRTEGVGVNSMENSLASSSFKPSYNLGYAYDDDEVTMDVEDDSPNEENDFKSVSPPLNSTLPATRKPENKNIHINRGYSDDEMETALEAETDDEDDF